MGCQLEIVPETGGGMNSFVVSDANGDGSGQEPPRRSKIAFGIQP